MATTYYHNYYAPERDPYFSRSRPIVDQIVPISFRNSSVEEQSKVWANAHKMTSTSIFMIIWLWLFPPTPGIPKNG